jgi:excisionase family DNA binding protein
MAAAELGVSRVRVEQLILAGRLKAEKFGKAWLIMPHALDAVRVRKWGHPPSTQGSHK